MRYPLALGLFLAVCGVWPGAPARAADPDELLRYIPAPVNMVAVVNVAAILSSPRASREGWSNRDHVEYLAGAVPVHPSVERILIAKELDPGSPGRGGVAAVIPLKAPLDIGKFAAARGGHVDEVAGEPVAVTANGSIGVKLGDKLLGLVRTDARQEVARWVRYAKGAPASQQQKYLTAAVHNSGSRHHILIALDTEDLFHPTQAGLAVARSEALAADKATADAVQAFLARLTGVRLTADITADGIAAEVRLDSAVPAKVNPEAMKRFVMELLDRNGAELEDLRAATVKAAGNAVTLTFKMSDPELARVMALIAPPVQGIPAADVITVAPAGVTPEASRRYYRAVNAALDDLKALNKKARDYEKTAVWHDTAANRIESLSVLNVDPLVVEYGAGTAGRLRAIADSLRGLPVQVAAVASEGYVLAYIPRPGVRPSSWAAGPQSVQTNLPEIRRKELELVKKGAENRGKLWDQIEQHRSSVRRAVAEKSNIDLEAGTKK